MYLLETTFKTISICLDTNEPESIRVELSALPQFSAFPADSFVFVPTLEDEIFVFLKEDLEYNERLYKRTILPAHWREYAAGVIKGLLSFHEPDAPPYILLTNLASGLSKKIHKIIVNGSYNYRETISRIPQYLDVTESRLVFLAGHDLGEDEQYVFEPLQLDFTQEGIFYDHLPQEFKERAIAVVRWDGHAARNDYFLRQDSEKDDEKNEDNDGTREYEEDAQDIELRDPYGKHIDNTVVPARRNH